MATFALAPTQSPNSFFEIYYNPAVVASDLAGTGFNVGTLILAASPDPTLPNSGNFALALNGSGNPIIAPFDQFNPVNYPDIQTVTGAGSASLGGDVSSFDPAFFETNLAQLSFDTSNITPFLQTDPSMLFVGSSGGGPPNVTPNIGTINGVNGTDFQFQADANSAFTAAPPTLATTPSPTTVTLGTTSVTLTTRPCCRAATCDGHDHLHAVPGQHAGGHRDGHGQRQRHVHDADGLHAADDGHGDRDLPVGRELQRRHATTTRPARTTPPPSR